MAYIRHDKDNNPVSPQPGSTEVTEDYAGWSAVTYDNWNVDYVARDKDGNPRVVGTYQARDKDGNPRTPASYQRHDSNNNPIP